METVFLDTETTGLDNQAEAVEIAIVDYQGRTIFESRCKPTVPIDPEAEAIHGITANSLSDHAPAWPDIAGLVRSALEGKQVVMFNAAFDTRILRQTATAYGDPARWLEDLIVECAMFRAVKIYPREVNRYGTISLSNAVFEAGIEFQGQAHSAAGDAATTALLWKAMDKRERERGNARKRWEKKKAEEVEQDAKPNALSKPEREAAEALKRLADSMLAGETCAMTNPELNQLRRMGITLEFVPAKQVQATVRSKGAAFTQYIGQTSAYWLSGTPYRCYMPWQIKKRKPKKR